MINLAAGILGQVIGIFGAKGKAAEDSLKARVSQMERSWTDEFLVVYWFSPNIIGLFSPELARELIAIARMDDEYFAIQVAITVAVFGLGKINGRSK